MLRSRAGPQMTALARALGVKQADLAKRVAELGGGPRRLSELGAEQRGIEAAVRSIMARQELQLTPDVPGAREIRELIEEAW
jgi:alcohol dehydrogenase class IV